MLLFPRSFEEDIRIFTFMAPVTFLNNVLQLDPPRETLSFTLNLFGVRVCSSISHLRSEIKKRVCKKYHPDFRACAIAYLALSQKTITKQVIPRKNDKALKFIAQDTGRLCNIKPKIF